MIRWLLMRKCSAVPALLGMFGLLTGACGDDDASGRGEGLTGVDGGGATGGSTGGSATGGSSGTGGTGGAAGGSVGSAGASGGNAGAAGADAGDPVCVWDGVTPRVSLECTGDLYEYFGPECRWTWNM